MDIDQTDIAALEKILHWAEELALKDPNEQAAAASGDAPPQEAPPPEESHSEEPALEVEVSAAPAPSTLKSYSFGGPPPRKREEEEPPRGRSPVPRKGRY